MSEHSELTAERWRRFPFDRQILMIANEMQRGLASMTPEYRPSLRLGYERVLRLVDLTVECGVRRNLRRELLRWRGVVGELYLADSPTPEAHKLALQTLLYLTPEAAKQVAALEL